MRYQRPGKSNEAYVREVLDRLGTPTELVNAASSGEQQYDEADEWLTEPVPDRGNGALEVLTIVLLGGAAMLAPLLPVSIPMWIAGVVMLVLAKRWSVKEKIWGGLVLGAGVPFVLFYLIVGGLSAFETCVVTTWEQVDSPGATPVEVTTVEGQCSSLGWVSYAFFAVGGAYLILLVWTIVRLARSARRA